MPHYSQNMRTPDEMKEPLDDLKVYTTSLLFEFAKLSDTTRDVIIRNFLARGMVSLNTIYKIARDGNCHDGWILHRSLIDRLVHLRALSTNNEFEQFEEWSFYIGGKTVADLKSDPEFGEASKLPGWQLTKDQNKRFKTLTKNPPQWIRPKPQSILKQMDLDFLFTYGYDYASMLVHPMADDGQFDFARLTNLGTSSHDGEAQILVNNASLVQTLLIQEGLNASTLSWRKVVWDFIGGFRDFLKDGSPEYLVTFLKINKLMLESHGLAKPNKRG